MSLVLVKGTSQMTSRIPHRCGHCKRLAPTWGELADFFANDDKVSIDHVDCTKQKSVCSKAKVGICLCQPYLPHGTNQALNDSGMQIGGYPTLRFYFNGAEQETYRGAVYALCYSDTLCAAQ